MSERVSSGLTPMPVERTETQVMFLRAVDQPVEIRGCWELLEARVGVRGRKFFGAFDPSTKEYRACVRLKEGDDPAALGLESGSVPGGRYLRVRLRGEPPEVYERIGPTFAALAKVAAVDETRPSIEFYRRRDEIDLLLPVVESRANEHRSEG